MKSNDACAAAALRRPTISSSSYRRHVVVYTASQIAAAVAVLEEDAVDAGIDLAIHLPGHWTRLRRLQRRTLARAMGSAGVVGRRKGQAGRRGGRQRPGRQDATGD